MGKREIYTGLFVILIIIGIVIGVRRARKTEPAVAIPTPTVFSTETIERTFNLVIPNDVEKINLVKLSDVEGNIIATRKFKNGVFNLTVLADLPDPVPGSFYQVWLGNDDDVLLSIGKLVLAKGGYLLDFEANQDYSSYKKVAITQETVFDTKPEKKIFSGSF